MAELGIDVPPGSRRLRLINRAHEVDTRSWRDWTQAIPLWLMLVRVCARIRRAADLVRSLRWSYEAPAFQAALRHALGSVTKRRWMRLRWNRRRLFLPTQCRTSSTSNPRRRAAAYRDSFECPFRPIDEMAAAHCAHSGCCVTCHSATTVSTMSPFRRGLASRVTISLLARPKASGPGGSAQGRGSWWLHVDLEEFVSPRTAGSARRALPSLPRPHGWLNPDLHQLPHLAL